MVKDKKEIKRGNPLINLFKAEWNYLGKKKSWFFIFMTFLMIASIIGLLDTLVIGFIFNEIQEGTAAGLDISRLLILVSLLFVIEVLFWVFWGPGRVIQERTSFFVNRNYINTKLRNVLALPMKWHRDHHSGDTIDKLNKSSNALNQFSSSALFRVTMMGVRIVVSLGILFYFDLTAGFIALGFSTFTLFFILQFDKKLHGQYKKLNEYDNKVSASLFDYISNITSVITLRLRNTVTKEVDSRLMAKYETFKKNVTLNEYKWATSALAISLMTSVVLGLKIYRDYTSTGIVLVGTLFILYGYLDRVGNTFFNFADLYGTLVRYDANLANMSPIDKEFRKVKEDNKLDMPEKWNEIELKDFNFKHNVRGRIAHLDNVGMKFKLGDKIALVGESGSGKSTIMGLIRGLNVAKSGKIFVDGEEIDHGLARLKKHVTLIPQDPEIFNNTIGYNINMDLPVKKGEMDRVIKMARFEKVLDRLPNGLKANVMEKGVSLSGGEKQRLALARGILAAKESEIVLMDEPTSSVDSVNERAIYEEVLKEFDDKVVISAIHKLHLLEKFDYVYLFDKGKVIAEGTLSEVKKNPVFKRMWKKYGGKK